MNNIFCDKRSSNNTRRITSKFLQNENTSSAVSLQQMLHVHGQTRSNQTRSNFQAIFLSPQQQLVVSDFARVERMMVYGTVRITLTKTYAYTLFHVGSLKSIDSSRLTV